MSSCRFDEKSSVRNEQWDDFSSSLAGSVRDSPLKGSKRLTIRSSDSSSSFAPGDQDIGSFCSCGLGFSHLFRLCEKANTEDGLLVIEFLAIAATTFITTFQYGFQEETVFDGWYLLGYVANVIASSAACLKLRRNVLIVRKEIRDANTLISARIREMRKRRSWLIATIIIGLPVDLLMWFSSGVDAIPFVRLLHCIPAFVVFPRCFGRLERTPTVAFHKARIMRITFFLVVAAHVVACFINRLSLIESESNYKYHAAWSLEGEDMSYMRTLYFSFMFFSAALAEHKIMDRSQSSGKSWEYTVGMLITITISVLLLYVEVNLTAVMLSTFQRIEQYRKKLTMVSSYLKRNKLSSNLSKLVVENFRQAYEGEDVESHEETLLQQMPLALSREIRFQKNIRTLRCAPIFTGRDRAVLKMLSVMMHPVAFMQAETVCTRGDVVRELLLLRTGAVRTVIHESEEEEDVAEEASVADSYFSELMDVDTGGDRKTAFFGGFLPSLTMSPSFTGFASWISEIPSSRCSQGTDPSARDEFSFVAAEPQPFSIDAPPITNSCQAGSEKQKEPLEGKRTTTRKSSEEGGALSVPPDSLGNDAAKMANVDTARNLFAKKRKSGLNGILNGYAPWRKTTTKKNSGLGRKRSSTKKSFVQKGSSLLEPGRLIDMLGLGQQGERVLPRTIQTPGQALCDLAFFFGLRQPLSMVAMKQTTCLLINMNDWRQVIKDFPQEGHQVMRRVMELTESTEIGIMCKPQINAMLEEKRAQADRLFAAVASGNEVLASSLLNPNNSFVNPAEVDHANNTALHVAVHAGRISMVEILLEFQAPVNAKDGEGRTPVAVALQKNQIEIAKAIRDAGGRLAWDNITASTELCEAAKVGDIERLTAVLICGANVNAHDYDSRTALHLAASSGNSQVVDLLLHHRARVNVADRWGGTPLRDAVTGNYRKVARKLCKARGTLNYSDARAVLELCECARNGNAERTGLLLQCGVNVNARDYKESTCLHTASAVGNKVILHMLLKAGANVNISDNRGSTPLHEAIMHGHLEMATEILKLGGRLNYTEAQSSYELSRMIREGKIERMRLLLQGNANIDALNNDGRSPVHVATINGSILIINALIRCRCDINIADRFGNTPLADAIENGFNEVARLLIRNKAKLHFDEQMTTQKLISCAKRGNVTMMHMWLSAGCMVDACDYDSRTVLHVCATEGSLHMIDQLIRFHADLDFKNRWGHTALFHAASTGHAKVARKLHRNGASLGFDEMTAATVLFGYVRVGDLEKIKLLLASGASVNTLDHDRRGGTRSCLHLAASTGNLKVVQALLRSKADPRACDRWLATPLFLAIREGHKVVFNAIHEAGGNVRLDEASASNELARMARLGNIKGIKMLLDGGANVNAANYDGRTCLHLAGSCGSLLVVEALLSHGCDVNFRDRWGATPLAAAVHEGHANVVTVLKQAGGVIRFSEREEMMVLSDVVRRGDVNGVAMLVEANVAVNTVDWDSRSALHLAASRGDMSMLRTLLDASANHDITDRWGQTALSHAIWERHHHVAEELRKAGCKIEQPELRVASQLRSMMMSGNIPGIHELLISGCSVDAADYYGRTCLHLSASNGDRLAVEALISRRCDVNKKDMWGRTPLNNAVLGGHLGVVQMLRDAAGVLGFVDANQAAVELSCCTKVGDIMGVRLLLKAGAPPDSPDRDGRTCLHLASMGGCTSVMLLLLEHEANVNAVDKELRSCLQLAAMNGHHAAVALLLATEGIRINQPDQWGGTALSHALLLRKFETATQLLAKGGRTLFPPRRAKYQLSQAVRSGALILIQMLVEGDVDPDGKDYDDRTPLMLAASLGDPAIVKMLLSAGVDINATDRWGVTALTYAVREGQESVMRLLLDAGGLLRWDKLVTTAMLCDLAQSGKISQLQMLLDCGVDPMSCDYDRRTVSSPSQSVDSSSPSCMHMVNWSAACVAYDPPLPFARKGCDRHESSLEKALHLAVASGHRHIIQLLIQRDADVNFTDRWGNSPMDCHVNEPAVYKVLKEESAKAYARKACQKADLIRSDKGMFGDGRDGVNSSSRDEINGNGMNADKSDREERREDAQREDRQRKDVQREDRQRKDVQREDRQREDVQLSDAEREDVQLANVEKEDVQLADVEREDVRLAHAESEDVRLADVKGEDMLLADAEREDEQLADADTEDVQLVDEHREDEQLEDEQREAVQLADAQLADAEREDGIGQACNDLGDIRRGEGIEGGESGDRGNSGSGHYADTNGANSAETDVDSSWVERDRQQGDHSARGEALL
ncbi:MAG: hypothetical protein SGPRY_003177, partial [Prymnesium sp.]